MAKISKNIKRLRTLNNMSQEELAQKLFISRQAVSSWENNRTQPDVEMVKKLSELFNVPVEELLYGEKRNTKLEESVKTNKTLYMVFSIVGSLFVGIGLIILFVALWDEFPNFAKASISFIPMLLGQVSAVYTYIKKFDKISWREGASIIWSLGITATIGLLSTVLNLHLGALICLLIDAILILPVLYFFKVVSPLVLYFGYTVAGAVGIADLLCNEYLAVAAAVVLTGLGVLYAYLNRKEFAEDMRSEYTQWICVLGSIAAVFAVCYALDWGYFALPLALVVCIYSLSKSDSWSTPFYPVGMLGVAISSVVISLICINSYYEGTKFFIDNMFSVLFSAKNILIIVLSAVILSIGFIFGEKSLDKNRYQSAVCFLGAGSVFVSAFSVIVDNLIFIGLILFALSFAQGIVLIIKGASEKSYFSLNVGLLMLLSLMFFLLWSVDLGMVTVGLMFLISGSSLFGANFYISKKIKKEQIEITKQAVEEDE
ncbi:MAG: DUF2157 domain-containing protein [Acutalibacteraceae bacterium]